MAMRYLGPSFDIHTGGDRQRLPPPRGRDRPVGGPIVGAVRRPATGSMASTCSMRGHKMAKSAGNFQRITELADDGARSARLPLPDLTRSHYSRKLEPLGYVDGRRRGPALPRSGLACGLSARRRPAARGRRHRSSSAGSAGDRPVGIASGVSGHRSGRAPLGGSRPGYQVMDRAGSPAATGRPRCRPRDGRCTSRFVASVDDDLDLPRAVAVVREIAEVVPARGRAALAGARCGRDPRPRLDRVWAAGAADHGTGASGSTEPVRGEVLRLVDERAAARAGRDFARADALRTELLALGYEVVDRPDGSTLREIGG